MSAGKRYDMLVRLLLVGDTGVGKTCLICKYAQNNFNEDHISTIGVDFKVKTIEIDGKLVKVQIWDTAGQERFESITKQFYRRAQGVMVVYDICSRHSFESLPKWVTYVKQFAKDDTVLMLLGNKSDQEHRRQVESSEAKQFADEHNLKFWETSAKLRENLDRPFLEMCTEIIRIESEKIPGYQTSDTQNTSIVIENTSVNHSDTTQLIENEEEEGEKQRSLSRWGCCNIL